MSAVVADTHAAVWYVFADPRLSKPALHTLQAASQILVPSIALVEINYLTNKGRLSPAVLPGLVAEINDPATSLGLAALDQDIALAVAQISRLAVPDMPDRIIAATALHYQVPLVTRDASLQSCGLATIW